MSVAEQMSVDALEAQRIVRKFFVVGLDFSKDSVEELEGLFDDVEFTMKGGKSEENIELLTRTWGAYLGEVLCRACQGEWIEHEGGAAVRIGEQTLSPHEQVRKRLVEGDAHNVAKFLAGVQS